VQSYQVQSDGKILKILVMFTWIFLKLYGDFENGIPVHDTIARVVSNISPKKSHEYFINWMKECIQSTKMLLRLMENAV